eukprot:12891496-Prorocentrum_lima.AAC.1
MQLLKHHFNMLNVFQLKGLRSILRMKTTYVELGNTNLRVYARADRALKAANPEAKPIRPLQQLAK